MKVSGSLPRPSASGERHGPHGPAPVVDRPRERDHDADERRLLDEWFRAAVEPDREAWP